MEVYTSHWRSSLLEDVDATIVSISRAQPRWPLPFRYRRFEGLAPDDQTWALEDRAAFEASYVSQLKTLGAPEILKRLARIGDGRALVLLCWERDPTNPETPCHRRYLAEFLEREAGIAVPELQPGDLPWRQDGPQLSLFDTKEDA